ncbi:hypothetical protein BGZ75_007881, partial [Mortierella antarctica]
MGVVGLWPLFKKRGYEPQFRQHVPLDLSKNDGTVCRVDIQGTFFMTIRSTYIRHPPALAHQIMEREISKMVPKERSVLYLDGAQAKEKETTHAKRLKTRQDSAAQAEELLAELQQRILNNERVRKWRFQDLKKCTNKVFYWSLQSRIEFADYLQQHGWQVQVAITEADLAIARACGPGDIVISKHSDMAIYGTVHRICRPISGGRFLVYDLQDVVATLNISREQLRVLGVVSRNDYNSNVPTLGSATNFKLVKDIVGTDPAKMVEYLALDQVVLTNESFTNARRVFIDLVQEPVPPTQPASDLGYEDLTHRLQDVRELYKLEQTRKDEQRRLSGRSSTSECIQKSEGFNRCRTVDRPPPGSGSSSWRPRYSHKAREQPAAKPLESMGKLDLMRAMRREHPISTLEIGTVKANARAALRHPPSDMSTLQFPWADVASAVDQCLKDVTKLASDTKRSCQLLVGRFVEQLSAQDAINSSDRELLDLICPRIPAAKTSQGITSDPIDDETEEQTRHAQFFTTLATYIYSGSCAVFSKVGRQVERTVGTQLATEYKQHFSRGTLRIQEKALKLKERRPEITVPEIHHNRSAVENFLVLNKANQKPWKLTPLSPAEHGFINISEKELVIIFCKNDLLKRVLLSLVRMDFRTATSQEDIIQWLRDKEPGYLIRRFVAHLGRDEQDPSTP